VRTGPVNRNLGKPCSFSQLMLRRKKGQRQTNGYRGSVLRTSIRSPIRPRRCDVIEPQIRDHLTHVFVGVCQQAQVDASDCRLFAKEMEASIELAIFHQSKGIRRGLK